MPQNRPVFLEKSRYRQRRLRDALFLLPVLGATLWMVPVLWSRGEGGQNNSQALIYIFAVWMVLVIAGAVLTRKLRPEDASEDQDDQG